MLRNSFASNLLTLKIITIDLVVRNPNTFFKENLDKGSIRSARQGFTSGWALKYGKIKKKVKNIYACLEEKLRTF